MAVLSRSRPCDSARGTVIVERIFLLTIPISVFIEGIGGVLYLVLLVKGEKPGAA